MNRLAYGVVATPPDGDGFGLVLVGGTTLRAFFQPGRFVVPWPVPAEGDRVAATTAALQGDPLKVLWVIGRGIPTYAP